MHIALVVTGVVIVAALVLGWVVGRFRSEAGRNVGLVGHLIARLVIVGVMAYSTTRAVESGGWFVVLAALLLLIGLGALAMAGVIAATLWMNLTGRVSD